MKQNKGYDFTYEPELLRALGEKRVGRIKYYHLEKLFDDLYDYYFDYSRDEVKAIQEAYDMILNFGLKTVREYIAKDVLGKYVYEDIKAVQTGFIYADTDSIRCEPEDNKIDAKNENTSSL